MQLGNFLDSAAQQITEMSAKAGTGCIKARKKMGEIALSAVGHHYLHGGKGARPGKNDGAPVRPGMVSLLKDNTLPAPAFFAGSAEFADGRWVCGGRSTKVGRWASPNDAALVRYLGAQDPSSPGKCFTSAGLTPRRAQKGDKHPGALVWGECCDGWRHFDCIGLVDFSLWKVSPKPGALRSVAQWASPHNIVGAVRMKNNDPVLDGDLVSVQDKGKYHHIGVIFMYNGKPLVVQAIDTDMGVAETDYDPANWTGGRWRLPDSFFYPDDAVGDDYPDMSYQPTAPLACGPV